MAGTTALPLCVFWAWVRSACDSYNSRTAGHKTTNSLVKTLVFSMLLQLSVWKTVFLGYKPVKYQQYQTLGTWMLEEWLLNLCSFEGMQQVMTSRNTLSWSMSITAGKRTIQSTSLWTRVSRIHAWALKPTSGTLGSCISGRGAMGITERDHIRVMRNVVGCSVSFQTILCSS